MEGKAMIVTMSRDIAVQLYEEIQKIRPEWHDEDDAKGALKIIMNEGLPPQEEKESEADYEKGSNHSRLTAGPRAGGRPGKPL